MSLVRLYVKRRIVTASFVCVMKWTAFDLCMDLCLAGLQ